MNYKYITDTVVAKIDDDGISRMSCSIENPEYLAWLSAGNTPEPADPVVRDVKAEIAALEAGQARAVREAALGDKTHLQVIEDKIAALRELL